MQLTITFPDNHKETFESVLEASRATGLSEQKLYAAARTGKKHLGRTRDKAEFSNEVKNFPRLKVSDGDAVYEFRTYPEAEELLGLT